MRLLSALLLLPLLLQAETKTIGTRDGVVVSPNRTITFPMQVRFADLVATNLATRGYVFPQTLGTPGQGLVVAPDGISLVFRAADGSGDMLKATYDIDNNHAADDADRLGGVLATNYATRAWVVDQIAAIEPVDLSNYVTSQELVDAIAAISLDSYALVGHTHAAGDIVSGRLDWQQMPVDAATTNDIDEAIAQIPLHDPVTSGDTFIAITNQVATLNTNALDQAGFVVQAELDEALANIPLPDLSAYALTTSVTNAIAKAHDAVTAGAHVTVSNQVVSVDTNSLDVAGGMATDAELAAVPTHSPLSLDPDSLGVIVDQILLISTSQVRAAVFDAFLSTDTGGTVTGETAQIIMTGASSSLQAASGVFLSSLTVAGSNVLTTASTIDAGSIVNTEAFASLPASALTGTLPALDGSALTGVLHSIGSGTVGSTEIADGSIALVDTAITGVSGTTKYLRGDWSWQTLPTSIGGGTGATDNLALRADGTGGATMQNSSLRIDDVTASTQQNLALVNVDGAAKSAIVISPKGLGAIIFGPKPDGGTGGGNSRGDKAFDGQYTRNGATQVASGESSVIGGGERNTASAFASTVAGGYSNVSSGFYSFTAGYQNQATAGNTVALGTRARANHDYSFCWGGSISYAATDRSGQFKLATDGGFSIQTTAGTCTNWGKWSSAPVSGVAEGDTYYDTTGHKMKCYNGSTWNDLF